jgi:ATP phosphoribosyltransferase regulatory subunit
MSANDNDHRGLLPAGLADLLPPDAAREARAIDIAIERFAAFGYERVKPPLVEFEESLLGGTGMGLAAQTFRLMDPVSQRMMGVRPDMTVQVARIAVTRLKHEPRPLRLSYGGNVIRVRGNPLKPERQFAQVGAELLGVDSAEADAEAILLTVDALRAIGVNGLTVDLNLPTLVAAIAAALEMSEDTLKRLRRALDRKDERAVAKVLDNKNESGKRAAELFVGLLRSTGPVEKAVSHLTRLELPSAAAAEASRLAEVVKLVRAANPDLAMTLDAVEYRGLEYQTGVSFTVFAKRGREELARGGRYSAGYPEDGVSEPATGFTLYMSAVLAASDTPPERPRLFVPLKTPWRDAAQWQKKGYAVVRAVAASADPRKEARRLRCSHALIDGEAVPL